MCTVTKKTHITQLVKHQHNPTTDRIVKHVKRVYTGSNSGVTDALS